MIRVDYIFKDGFVVDGNRRKPYKADIIIKDNRIIDIDTEDKLYEGEVINISGKFISPGFIDIHTHSDRCYLLQDKPLSKVYQGITSEIGGNCGISTVPLCEKNNEYFTNYFNRILDDPGEFKPIESHNMLEYKKELEGANLPINLGILIGHGTLRSSVMGFEDRPPTHSEMDDMCEILSKELKVGAFGMSLGLIYPPGSFSQRDELIILARVLKAHEKILTVHMRNESSKVFEALDEMIDVARETGVHLHISHLKLIGKNQWGKSDILLGKIDKAREEGLKITCDQYPYTATSTALSALVPKWANDGGTVKMLERLKMENPQLDMEIEKEMENRGGAPCVSIAGSNGHMKEVEGLNIYEISQKLNLSPVDCVKTIIIKCNNNVSAVFHSLDEGDVLNIMKRMYISIGSDGYALSLGEDLKSNPHPRSFATFPRFLQTVRDNNLMPIEDAVYKMTKLSADILGLEDRGVLEVGKIADITVFDYKEIRDNSTFINSRIKPSGIEHVFVSGKPLVLYGEEVERNNGKILSL